MAMCVWIATEIEIVCWDVFDSKFILENKSITVIFFIINIFFVFIFYLNISSPLHTLLWHELTSIDLCSISRWVSSTSTNDIFIGWLYSW